MAEEKKIKKVLRVDKQSSSSLSAFVERPTPTDKEVASFERIIGREARNQEIDTNLNEIYTNKLGEFVDVRKMKIRHQQALIVRFFKNILIITLLAAMAYFAYSYFFDNSNDSSALEIKIYAPEKVMAGEEFSYKVEYNNPSKFNLAKLYLEVQYPENFILITSSIAPQNGNYGWSLNDLGAGASGSLMITGKLINKPQSVNIISGRLSYVPLNYSSQFKKEASASTLVEGPGFNVNLEYSNTAFLGQDNSMTLIISDIKENYFGDFNLSFALPDETNAQVVPSTNSKDATSTFVSEKINVTNAGGTSWLVSGLNKDSIRQEIPLSYKIASKLNNPEIRVRLEKKLDDGQSFIFWEYTFKPELVKTDLNLTTEVNGDKNDNSVNFGQTMNYTVKYSNKGDNTFKDLVIMTALTGDFLDFSSIRMTKRGEVRDNMIIWTKNEIPGLAEVKPNQEGEINFSINILAFKESDLGKKLTVTSYSQYGVNNQTAKSGDNKSNTIISRINSDLSLDEQILYFDHNNQPVGSGPLPPKVGELTEFKVYWVVKNNLHELSDARVVYDLPSNVSFDQRSSNDVGSIYYDANTRQVIWNIGRLPVSVYQAKAEFGISITPLETDRNKILVLTSGSSISAVDTETKDTINKKTGPKTTKLEDDDIAGMNNTGRVQ